MEKFVKEKAMSEGDVEMHVRHMLMAAEMCTMHNCLRAYFSCNSHFSVHESHSTDAKQASETVLMSPMKNGFLCFHRCDGRLILSTDELLPSRDFLCVLPFFCIPCGLKV